MHKAVVGTKLPPLPLVVHIAFCIAYSTAGMLITGLIRSLKFASQSKLCPLEMVSTTKSQQNWQILEYLTVFDPLLKKKTHNMTNMGLGEQEFLAEFQEYSPEYINHYPFSLLSGIPLFLGWKEALGSQQLYCWQPSGHSAAAEHWIWLTLWEQRTCVGLSWEKPDKSIQKNQDVWQEGGAVL